MTITWEQYLAGELDSGKCCKVCAEPLVVPLSRDGKCQKCAQEFDTTHYVDRYRRSTIKGKHVDGFGPESW